MLIAMASRSSSSKLRARDQVARIGTEVKLARVTHAMSRQRVATLAGVSWSTELRVELGDPHIGLETMCAVAEAVGLDVVLRAYPGSPPRLRDSGQLDVAERLVSSANAVWQAQLELVIGPHGESIDVALFGPDEIIALEIERMAADFQNQYRRAESKRKALAEQHARPVRLVLAIEDTRRNRTAVAPHLPFIRTVLPAASREVLAAIRGGRRLGRDGLVWIRRSIPRSKAQLERR
jgi:transcriptional regulator with XRE-family HTH domain